MCGRYTLYSNGRELERYYGTGACPQFKQSYNIVPSTGCPVIRLDKDQKREIALCNWGLVPRWAKSGSKIRPINAKAETVGKKPFFRHAFKQQRCLVPANGFYEWKGTSGNKQPYYIKPVGKAFFSFAGLWDHWESPEETIESFTIITTRANRVMSPIHSRMPVILAADNLDKWLHEGGKELLEHCPDDQIEITVVSTRVNRPTHDSADLIRPGREHGEGL